MTKFCKDCRHYRGWMDCSHPSLTKRWTGLVSGQHHTAPADAFDQRHTGQCGPDAKLFEPKDDFFSWLARFFRFGL